MAPSAELKKRKTAMERSAGKLYGSGDMVGKVL